MKWWEDICTGCGLCCHDKVRVDRRTYVLLSTTCPHLGPDNRCSVYSDRFKVCPSCHRMTVFNAMFTPWLPPQCAYLQWAKRHHIRLARRVSWAFALDEKPEQ